MHPPAGRPDVTRHVFEESDDVVVGALFNFENLPELKPPLRPDRLSVLLGNHPDLRLGLTGQRLDLEPDFIFALVRPDGGHFGKRVAVNHAADTRPRPENREREKILAGHFPRTRWLENGRLRRRKAFGNRLRAFRKPAPFKKLTPPRSRDRRRGLELEKLSSP